MPEQSNRPLSTGLSHQNAGVQPTEPHEGMGRSPLGPPAKPRGALPLAQCLQQHGPPSPTLGS
eukprot:8766816-Prorocentrum_lima.AAC.1